MKKVTIIEPVVDEHKKLLRTACYARVSSDSAEQLNSFESQVRFFKSYANDIPNAYLVKIYTDEGITGTSQLKRDGFNEMIDACRNNLIDRIITKSISRFGRNMTETLKVLRELKAFGVSVHFLTENIDTAQMGSEMMLAVYSICAEMESKMLAYNQRWGFRTRAKEGIYNQPHLPFGYYRSNGEITINKAEASIVEKIFRMYVDDDKSTIDIARYLNSVNAGNKKWNRNTVSIILKNERYCGDMLLQKKYTPEVFPFKLLRNKGDLPQYYVFDVFPKIIERELYQSAVSKLESKKKKFNKNQVGENNKYIYTSRIICKECSCCFKRRILRGKEYWSCKNHVDSADKCSIKMIAEDELDEAFLKIMYKLKDNLYVLESYKDNMQKMGLDDESTQQLNAIESELTMISREREKLLRLHQRKLIDLQNYKKKDNELLMDKSLMEFEKSKIAERTYKRYEVLETKLMIDCLMSVNDLEYIDEDVFNVLIDHLIIGKKKIKFVLKNDLILTVEREVYSHGCSNKCKTGLPS